MSTEKDRLIGPSGQPTAPPPGPVPYPEQPPPYAAPRPPQGQPLPPYAGPQGQPLPPYAAPQGQPLPPYAAPPPPQGQPYPPYGSAPGHNVTVIHTQPTVRHLVVDVKPPSYIILSVLVMIFGSCAFIFGLIALVYALQVDSAWAAGDRVRARQSSRKAKGWSVAGIIFGIALYVVIVIIAIAVNVANNSNYNG